MIRSRFCACLLSCLPFVAGAQAREMQSIPATDILHCAETELERHSAGQEGLEWSPAEQVESSNVPAGRYALQAGVLQGRWPRARVGIPVHVSVDGIAVQSRVVWFSVKQWRQGWVYARSARPGDVMAPDLVRVERMDVIGADVPDPDQQAWMADHRLHRSVRAGQLVLRSDIEPIPAVSRNEEVALDVHAGAVRLLTKAVAYRDGEVDEMIDVRPEGVSGVVKARVVGKGEVQIGD
ncbi:MAG TPA: flagellar basal body P-ring formation chaperone FlgA [Rhodanobacter sp.]